MIFMRDKRLSNGVQVVIKKFRALLNYRYCPVYAVVTQICLWRLLGRFKGPPCSLRLSVSHLTWYLLMVHCFDFGCKCIPKNILLGI